MRIKNFNDFTKYYMFALFFVITISIVQKKKIKFKILLNTRIGKFL